MISRKRSMSDWVKPHSSANALTFSLKDVPGFDLKALFAMWSNALAVRMPEVENDVSV